MLGCKPMSYIESFNRCTAIIFDELYRSFPFRQEISSRSLPASVFDDVKEDDYYDAFERSMVFEKTAQWLVEAGYIWAEEVREQKIQGAILSPKGLEVLKAISNKRTIGE